MKKTVENKKNMLDNLDQPKFSVVTATPLNLEKYLDITSDVFREITIEKIKKNINQFNGATRFYLFENQEKYVSVLFFASCQNISLSGGWDWRCGYKEELQKSRLF